MKHTIKAVSLAIFSLWALPCCVSSELQIVSDPEGSSSSRSALKRLAVKESSRYHFPLDLMAQEKGSARSLKSQRGGGLTLQKLMKSVEGQFPLILATMESAEIAAGEVLAAQGGFDLKLKTTGGVNALGYYQNEMASVKLEQPIAEFGATVFGGYKLGHGDFAVWDGGLQTNDGGEFSVGVKMPLLAGRAIDKRRVALWKARISQDQAQPLVLQKRLEVTRKAAAAYWKWVAAGKKIHVAQRLLSLAQNRHKALESSVKEGEMPRLVLVENRRLIVERKSILIRSHRILQQTAIQLSLYWRNLQGNPQVLGVEMLPHGLPNPRDPQHLLSESDLRLALLKRPELRLFDLKLREIDLKTQMAKNDRLPRLDLIATVSKDVGREVTTPDTKGPVEAGVFLQLEIPLQQRKAKGRAKILSAQSIQVRKKKQFAIDQVVAEVKDGTSALNQAWLRIAQARENVELAAELEEAERMKLADGDSDLLRVNLREQQTASAAASLVNTITEYFTALANYQASIGLPYVTSRR